MVIRIFDISLSFIALLILSPLLLIVCFILRFTGERQIIFTQERIGLNGNLFCLYKFATMLKDSPNIGTGTVTLFDDPRILPFGNILRKTKINELPQLLNVLRGDMSLIGPRPQTARCFQTFSHADQKTIMLLKPGLSGIGSIIFRNEDYLLKDKSKPTEFYDSVIMPYKGKLEIWYYRNQTLYNYFALIFLTLITILLPNNLLVWKMLKDVPYPPESLKHHIM